jgi:hypothetical protein
MIIEMYGSRYYTSGECEIGKKVMKRGSDREEVEFEHQNVAGFQVRRS